jgi:adenylate kinase
MSRKRVRAIIFGPQGAGKTTQTLLLSEWFGTTSLSSGELLRGEMESRTELGQLVKRYVEHGVLAPDEVVNAILRKRLMVEAESKKGFFLDGFPRNIEQANELDRYANINLAIHLKVSDAVAESRMLGRLFCNACYAVYHEEYVPLVKAGVCTICGGDVSRRADDADDGSVRDRLLAYHFMTEPLVTYYRQQGVLLSVNADQPIPFLFQELVKKLTKLGFVPTA